MEKGPFLYTNFVLRCVHTNRDQGLNRDRDRLNGCSTQWHQSAVWTPPYNSIQAIFICLGVCYCERSFKSNVIIWRHLIWEIYCQDVGCFIYPYPTWAAVVVTCPSTDGAAWPWTSPWPWGSACLIFCSSDFVTYNQEAIDLQNGFFQFTLPENFNHLPNFFVILQVQKILSWGNPLCLVIRSSLCIGLQLSAEKPCGRWTQVPLGKIRP